ncbi:Retrovirus-related Pol polyprotein from transposon TNT 1-94 [Vitis vinifera]|uniref:Retrovirus-related Pol polyprotein from transposon TNT 1-94 n=1 Tax=Vitis vinifera TaxID=29760 RepID=A0A438DM41_VITVI|nr:Retrovirus-related Pol polyprotein from transposon TNT 1-94 [Vitis vinifera]
MITSKKLVGSENYLYWSTSVELWFMGQGYEDRLVTQEADIPETKGLYTNDIQRLYKVASSIVNVRQQDMDLSTYIGQIASLKEEFLTVMPLTTDVGDQRTQIDKFFMVLTLISLRPDLETVRDQILGNSSVPSLDDVFARLLRISSTQTLSADNTSDSSVLVSQTNSRGRRSGNRGKGQRFHCTYCNKFGHTCDRCYQLHGRPPRTAHVAQSSSPQPPQPPSSSTSQGISLTNSEYDDYLRYQATKSAFVTSVVQTGNASVCFTHTSFLGPWILDSGASDHISGNKDLFSSITTTSALPTDRSTEKTIGIGRESQGLYHLTSPSTPAICISTDVSTDAPLLIHSHLGHPSLSKFQKMVPRFSSLSSLACESCQLRKHTRVSFPKSLNNRAKSYFELVHTDVWDPCRIASTLRFQYFVTFIDDYSRCTWLFLMKNRAELFSIFQKFYAEIQTQFNISIRVLRNDNVREYFSAPFTSFMSQHGILHQSSCAHTPQQNGVAERKNRHLVETARTLLLHSNIPHSLLFPDQPFYFFPPRVFGCTCFVHILTPRQDKLSAKATKCIFLGCSRLQKGYRCYSFETHRYFFSADGTFFEDSPFFSTSESLPVFAVLPLPIISPSDAVPSRPLQVYHRHHRVVVPPLAEVPADSLPIPSASPVTALPPSTNLPIALRKAPLRLFSIQAADKQCWVYTVKVGPDGQVNRLKARLVAKGYTQTKDLGKFKYFLGIEIVQSNSGVVFPKGRQGEPLGDPGRYRRLIGQGVLYKNRGHTQVVGYTDADWADSPTDRRSTSEYCVFIGGNLIFWKSKKQDVVTRSSAKAKYRAMALATCEPIWLKHLLRELRFGKDEQMKLICDNQAALHIASNPIFHERTKHIEVDCHFIREKIALGCVATSFVNSNDQLADIFTKSLRGPRIKYICNKLGAYNIYAPA